MFQLTRQVFEEYRPHLFWLDVFEHNHAMLALSQSLGFEHDILQDGHGLVRVVLVLNPPAVGRPDRMSPSAHSPLPC